MADRATWSKRVEAWRASGLKATEFSSHGGFAERTLRWWAWRLERESRAFVRVVRTDSPRAALDGSVMIEIGDARVVLSAGFDRAALHDVIAVLRETRS